MFALNISTIEFLLFGLSWSLTYGFWCTYSSNIILQQIIHFYLVCEIFKQRLRAIKKHLSGMKFDEIPTNEKKRRFFIKFIDEVYSDVKTYNDKYWSQFLFINCANFLMIVNTNLYLSQCLRPKV
jgi:hypothetical protein